MISIIVAIVVIGLVLWLVQQLPLDPQLQNIIRILCIVGIILWLITTFLGGVPSLR